MSYESLKQAVLSVQDNNTSNDASWSDWTGADHIADVYELFGLAPDECAILNRAIKTNGASLDDDLDAAELAEWGQTFAPPWWNRSQP